MSQFSLLTLNEVLCLKYPGALWKGTELHLTSLFNTLSAFRFWPKGPALPSPGVKKAKANFANNSRAAERDPLQSRGSVFHQLITVEVTAMLLAMSNSQFLEASLFSVELMAVLLTANSSLRPWSYLFFQLFHSSSLPWVFLSLTCHTTQAQDILSPPKHTSKGVYYLPSYEQLVRQFHFTQGFSTKGAISDASEHLQRKAAWPRLRPSHWKSCINLW